MGRGAHRAAVAVTLLALAGLVPACERRSSPEPVGAVVVRSADLSPALAEAGIDEALLVEAARGALAGAGFELDEGARRSYRATLSVIAFGLTSAPEGAVAEVVVELELVKSWAAGPAQREVGRARVALPGASPHGAWREALRGATKDAAQRVALALQTSLKSTEALLRDLSGGDPRARERALRALAGRGARSAARAVAERVRDPDPAVARAAIDTLTTFRDPVSTLALIDAAQAGDAGTTLRLIPVLAEIGGDDVEGYLLTLRSGHADRAVRQAADSALSGARIGARPPPPPGAKR